MIDIQDFISFLKKKFDATSIWIENFKPDLIFVQIDCFIDKPFKLSIEVSSASIKFATVSKEPEFDFSLYDYVFENNTDAESFIFKSLEGGYPIKK